MPLARENVTAASRIMLPTYVIGFTWIGLGWILDKHSQLVSSPALQFADSLLPLSAWGGLLVAVGFLVASALLAHRRTLCRFALWVAAIVMGVFFVVFGLAALFTDASPGAPAWPFIVGCACLASERSLLLGERQ